MSTKRSLQKFVCPKCNAQFKGFAEGDKKRKCFKCSATMVPMAESLPAPSKEGDAKKEATPAKEEPTPKKPDESSSTASNYSNVQTTVQEIDPSRFDVVVTETGDAMGGVEVNTFRITDSLPESGDSQQDAESGRDISQADSKLEEDAKKQSAGAVPANDVLPEQTPSEESEATPLPSSDVASGSSTATVAESKIAEQEEPVADSAERNDTKSVDEIKGNEVLPDPHEAELQLQPIEDTPDDSVSKDRVSKKAKSRKADAKRIDEPVEKEVAKTDKEKGTTQSKPPLEKQSSAKSATNDLAKKDIAKDDSAESPKLLTEYANENVWFRELLSFAHSAEFVLRYLLISLSFGLGLSFLLGDWEFISLIGYVFVIPGCIMLAVAGADVAIETRDGSKRITHWTSWSLELVLRRSVVVLLSFLFAVIPGLLISLPFVLSVGGYWLTISLGVISVFGLFPVLFLSMLENGSIAQPFSGEIFGTLRAKWPNWQRLYLYFFVSAIFLVGFGLVPLAGGGFFVCFVSALGATFVLLVQFRMIGFHRYAMRLEAPSQSKKEEA